MTEYQQAPTWTASTKRSFHRDVGVFVDADGWTTALRWRETMVEATKAVEMLMLGRLNEVY